MPNFDDDDGDDRRHFSRLGIPRVAIGQTATRDFVGAVKDISVRGVALEAEVRPHVGDAVALEIQDMKPLAGTVSRTLEDGFVVTYDLNGEDEDELIADVMKINNALALDDD